MERRKISAHAAISSVIFQAEWKINVWAERRGWISFTCLIHFITYSNDVLLWQMCFRRGFDRPDRCVLPLCTTEAALWQRAWRILIPARRKAYRDTFFFTCKNHTKPVQSGFLRRWIWLRAPFSQSVTQSHTNPDIIQFESHFIS